MSPKVSKRVLDPAEDFDTLVSLRRNAARLQAAIDSVQLNGSGEHRSTTAAVSRMSEALTKVCAELRQHERHSQRQLDSFPIDALVERLKALPEDQRRDIARELGGERDEESLL